MRVEWISVVVTVLALSGGVGWIANTGVSRTTGEAADTNAAPRDRTSLADNRSLVAGNDAFIVGSTGPSSVLAGKCENRRVLGWTIPLSGPIACFVRGWMNRTDVEFYGDIFGTTDAAIEQRLHRASLHTGGMPMLVVPYFAAELLRDFFAEHGGEMLAATPGVLAQIPGAMVRAPGAVFRQMLSSTRAWGTLLQNPTDPSKWKWSATQRFLGSALADPVFLARDMLMGTRASLTRIAAAANRGEWEEVGAYSKEIAAGVPEAALVAMDLVDYAALGFGVVKIAGRRSVSGGLHMFRQLPDGSRVALDGTERRALARVAGFCFTAGTPVHTPHGLVAIERIALGSRVLTSRDAVENATEVDPTWRRIELEMEDPRSADGMLHIAMLRPQAWLDARNAHVGSWVEIALSEMHVRGRARLTSIGDPPRVATRDIGRVVLTTIESQSANVLVLKFRGTNETLEPTFGHRLFSIDRNDWIQAGKLHVSERLRAEDGDAIVESITSKPGVHIVYNFEVEAEHEYLVGTLGVQSHNDNDCGATGPTDFFSGEPDWLRRAREIDNQQRNARFEREIARARAAGNTELADELAKARYVIADNESDLRRVPFAAERGVRDRILDYVMRGHAHDDAFYLAWAHLPANEFPRGFHHNLVVERAWQAHENLLRRITIRDALKEVRAQAEHAPEAYSDALRWLEDENGELRDALRRIPVEDLADVLRDVDYTNPRLVDETIRSLRRQAGFLDTPPHGVPILPVDDAATPIDRLRVDWLDDSGTPVPRLADAASPLTHQPPPTSFSFLDEHIDFAEILAARNRDAYPERARQLDELISELRSDAPLRHGLEALARHHQDVADSLMFTWLEEIRLHPTGEALDRALDRLDTEARDVFEAARDAARGNDAPGPVGGLCFTAGTEVHTAHGLTAIENIELGARVLTTRGVIGRDTEVDGSWRRIELEMEDPRSADGQLRIALLRPATWLETRHAHVGATIDIELTEMDVRGSARVTSIGRARNIAPGIGRVVLSTIESKSARVVVLKFQDSHETLEPTFGHRLYSLDRNAWVEAGKLRIGERLRAVNGAAVVASITPKPGTHTVYNFEVEAEHEYLVGKLGVQSHNDHACGPTPSGHRDAATVRRVLAELVGGAASAARRIVDGARMLAETAWIGTRQRAHASNAEEVLAAFARSDTIQDWASRFDFPLLIAAITPGEVRILPDLTLSDFIRRIDSPYVNEIVADSMLLREGIASAEARGVRVGFTAPGHSGAVTRPSHGTDVLGVDPTSPPEGLVGEIAHEVGHARHARHYEIDPRGFDTEEAFVAHVKREGFREEARATLFEAMVHRELRQNGWSFGPDSVHAEILEEAFAFVDLGRIADAEAKMLSLVERVPGWNEHYERIARSAWREVHP